jgi:heme-degrading monooxygenase HmoA
VTSRAYTVDTSGDGKVGSVAWVLIEHRVGDFEVFRQVFLGDATRRERLGCKGGRVYRVVDDPRTVIVMLEWDDVEAAREFAGSLELEQAMEWSASHISTPRVTVLEVALEPPR